MNLSNVNGLEHVAWAVYDGVYMAGEPLALTGQHEWAHIIMEMTSYLIFCGVTNSGHCEPLTVTSLNGRQTTKLVQQQELPQPKKRRSWAMPAAEAWRTPTVQSMVNVPPEVASSCYTGEAQAASLDFDEDPDDEDSFHESNGGCFSCK